MRKPFYWKARKTWYVRVEDGNGKLETISLAKNRSDAFRIWREMQIDADDQLKAGGNLLVAQLVRMYVEHLHSSVELGLIEPSTLVRRQDYLSSFSEAISQSLTVSKFRPYHVEEWLQGQSNWNATTRHHGAKTVKSIFKWAFDAGRIPRNPVQNLTVKKGAPRDFIIDAETYALILEGTMNPRCKRPRGTPFRSYLMLLKLTGCRPSEPAAVSVSDWNGETWTIRQHKNRKKQVKPRIVYLCPCAQTLSRIHAAGRTSGPLLRPDPSRPWKYSDLRKRWERLRDRKGISKKCVLYSHRHTWITNAMIAIRDVAMVAEMAGTSIQMIDQHYGHLSNRTDLLVKSARKIAVGQRDTN